MGGSALVLRDIHSLPAPPWWPPAPGWWLLAAVLLALIVAVAWVGQRRRRQRQAIIELFDRSVDAAGSPAAQVAAMSELLRRAARRRDAAADRLQGEAWLAFLDAQSRSRRGAAASDDFSRGHGRLLLDGGYRRDVAAADVQALRTMVRARFLQWMGAK